MHDSHRRRDFVLLGAIMIAAAVLRFHHIGHESLWLDEGASVGIARLPWGDFFKLLWRREMNMALYYLLLKPWIWLGSSEAWIRSLSAVFSVATVPFIYLVGREVRNWRTGIIATVLFALSPFAVTYGQEARGYSLVCLLVTVATWFLLRRVSGAWAVTIILAIYAHFFAALVLVAHLLWRALARKRSDGEALWRRLALERRVAKIALALLPIAAFVILKSRGQLNWVPRLSFANFTNIFGEFAGGGDLAMMVLFLVILAAVLTWRGPFRENRTLMIWLWLAFPIFVLLAVSIFHPMLIARFLMICLPALMIAVAIALAEFPKPLAALLLLAIAFFSIRTEVLSWRTQTKDDWRSATAYVLSQSTPNDGIIFHQALGRQAFEYYVSRAKPANAPQVISPAHGSRITYRDFEDDNEDKVALKLQGPPQSLWLMLSRNETNGTQDEYSRFLREIVKQRYRDCNRHDFRGVEVMRCKM